MSTPDRDEAITIPEPDPVGANPDTEAAPVLDDRGDTAAAVRAAVGGSPSERPSKAQETRRKLEEAGASPAFLEMLEEMEGSETGLGVRARNGTLWKLASVWNKVRVMCRRTLTVEGPSLQGAVAEEESVYVDACSSYFYELESDGLKYVVLMRKLAHNPELAGRLVASPNPRTGIKIAYKWKWQELPMYISYRGFRISGEGAFEDTDAFDPESVTAEDIDSALDCLENAARLAAEEKRAQKEAQAALERAAAEMGELPDPVPEEGTFEFVQYNCYVALMRNPAVKGRLALKDNGILLYEWEGKRFQVLVDDDNARIFFDQTVDGEEQPFHSKTTRKFDPAKVTAKEIDQAFSKLFAPAEPVTHAAPKVLDVPPPAASAEMVEGPVDAIIDEDPRLDAPKIARGKNGPIAYGSDRGIGYKDENQDRLLIKTEQNAFACIDGMGGYDEGALAAQLLAEAFSEGFAKGGMNMEAMQIAAHESMKKAGLRQDGACYIAAKIVGDKLHVGQAGDVRLIVVTPENKVIFQTRDQGVGARVDNAVTGLQPGYTTTDVVDLKVGYRIIVGTDGLWNNISLEEAAQLPREIGKAIGALNDRAKEKMARAPEHERQGIPAKRDNISAIIYDIEKLD